MKKTLIFFIIAIPAYLAGYYSALVITSNTHDEVKSVLETVNEKIGKHSQSWFSAELEANMENLEFLVSADKRMDSSDEIVRKHIKTVERSISRMEDNLKLISSTDVRQKIESRIQEGRQKIEELKFDYGM